jgi:hypothetical protein
VEVAALAEADHLVHKLAHSLRVRSDRTTMSG